MMAGEDEDFVVHLNGTLQLRNSRKNWKIIGDTTRQLNKISAFLALLARTLSFQAPPSLWLGRDDDISFSDDPLAGAKQSGLCYVYLYGITPNVAAAIQETCRLSEQLHQLASNRDQNPEPFLFEKCEELGERLLSWRLESENAASTLAGDETMSRIFEHYAKAWHYAALIYYYHRIQNYNIEDLVEQTECVAKHMNMIEDIKAASKFETISKMAPITWPIFIASCGSMRTKRESYRRWWVRVQHYGIANIKRQWDVIQMIWEKQETIRQGESREMSWIDIYCQMGINLLPI
jgi:arginine metabolism regulation protein II